MITEFSETDNEKRWFGDFDTERTLNIWDVGVTNLTSMYGWMTNKKR